MGGTSYPISGKTLRSIADYYKNKDTKFYKPVIGLYKKSKMGILFKSSDSRVERKKLPNGNIQVDFVYALDDNRDASDGRIFIRDEFVFSKKDQKFKSYYRSYSYNRKGSQRGAWKDWLGKYRALDKPTSSMAKQFANSVARGYVSVGTSSRPTPSTTKAISIRSNRKFIPSLGNDGIKYLNSTAEMIQREVYPLLSVKVVDPQSTYTVVKRGKEIEVSISLLVKIYRKGEPPVEFGEIFWRDTFLLDAKTKKLKKFKGRTWELASGSKNNFQLVNFPKYLNGKPKPSFSEAETYIHNLVPAIFPGTSRPSDTTSTTSTTSTGSVTQVVTTKRGYTFSFPALRVRYRKDMPFNTSWFTRVLNGPGMKSLERISKKFGTGFTLRFMANITIDNRTGRAVKVAFKDVRTFGRNAPSLSELKGVFKVMAKAIYNNTGFKPKKGVGNGTYKVRFRKPIALTVQ